MRLGLAMPGDPGVKLGTGQSVTPVRCQALHLAVANQTCCEWDGCARPSGAKLYTSGRRREQHKVHYLNTCRRKA